MKPFSFTKNTLLLSWLASTKSAVPLIVRRVHKASRRVLFDRFEHAHKLTVFSGLAGMGNKMRRSVSLRFCQSSFLWNQSGQPEGVLGMFHTDRLIVKTLTVQSSDRNKRSRTSLANRSG